MNQFSTSEAELLLATHKPFSCSAMETSARPYPQVVKYMGSKASLLSFIASGINQLNPSKKTLVDLFAGAAAISGGFGHSNRIVSNDIQTYSATIASIYLRRATRIGNFDITALAEKTVQALLAELPTGLSYDGTHASLEYFNDVEAANRALLNRNFTSSHHLFTRAYSGTWWSAEQCVWIDAIRKVLDELIHEEKIGQADFDFGLTCLLHAMAYTSQGTGHYAQYRDAKTMQSMADILKYRLASVQSIFDRKFKTLLKWNHEMVVDLGHEISSMDYRDRLQSVDNAIIYADPPYAFVHYSRFYHAMETLVKYDYPELQHARGEIVKGRYRSDRHQSPFCIRTQVNAAFEQMFDLIRVNRNELVLSYSNTGMIDINDLIALAAKSFGPGYQIASMEFDHQHMTMGRAADRSRAVRESLILARRI